MVSTTEVGGGGKTPNGPTARKNQSKPNNKKPVGFKGDAKAESVLHGKVITSGSNQAGQIIALVANLSSFIGDKSFPHWAESIRLMQRKHDMTSCQLMLVGVPMVPRRQVFLYRMEMHLIRKTNTTEIQKYGTEV